MLIAQGLDDCEIIVVNDGSTDATSEIVYSYSKKNERIKIIDKINEGVSVARNTGMEHSTGKYIIFLDSDDIFELGTLDFYRKVLGVYPNKDFFAFGYYTKYKNKIKKDYAVKQYDEKILDSNLLKQSFFLKKICFHICSCIYESSFLIKHSIQFTPGVRIGEDVEFLLKVLAVADSCVYHARHCFVYQIRDDSVMQGYKKYSLDYFNSFIKIYNSTQLIDCDELKKNYFIVFNYMSNLYHYLKSGIRSDEIDRLFTSYKYVLSFSIPFSILKFLKMILKIFLFRI